MGHRATGIRQCQVNFTRFITHPLFAPLGTRNGKTMPTTPQNIVKTRNETTDAPIFATFIFGKTENVQRIRPAIEKCKWPSCCGSVKSHEQLGTLVD